MDRALRHEAQQVAGAGARLQHGLARLHVDQRRHQGGQRERRLEEATRRVVGLPTGPLQTIGLGKDVGDRRDVLGRLALRHLLDAEDFCLVLDARDQGLGRPHLDALDHRAHVTHPAAHAPGQQALERDVVGEQPFDLRLGLKAVAGHPTRYLLDLGAGPGQVDINLYGRPIAHDVVQGQAGAALLHRGHQHPLAAGQEVGLVLAGLGRRHGSCVDRDVIGAQRVDDLVGHGRQLEVNAMLVHGASYRDDGIGEWLRRRAVAHLLGHGDFHAPLGHHFGDLGVIVERVRLLGTAPAIAPDLAVGFGVHEEHDVVGVTILVGLVEPVLGTGNAHVDLGRFEDALHQIDAVHGDHRCHIRVTALPGVVGPFILGVGVDVHHLIVDIDPLLLGLPRHEVDVRHVARNPHGPVRLDALLEKPLPGRNAVFDLAARPAHILDVALVTLDRGAVHLGPGVETVVGAVEVGAAEIIEDAGRGEVLGLHRVLIWCCTGQDGELGLPHESLARAALRRRDVFQVLGFVSDQHAIRHVDGALANARIAHKLDVLDAVVGQVPLDLINQVDAHRDIDDLLDAGRLQFGDRAAQHEGLTGASLVRDDEHGVIKLIGADDPAHVLDLIIDYVGWDANFFA